MSKKVEYTITQKRKAISAAWYILNSQKHYQKYAFMSFGGDDRLSIGDVCNILEVVYREMREKELQEEQRNA